MNYANTESLYYSYDPPENYDILLPGQNKCNAYFFPDCQQKVYTINKEVKSILHIIVTLN